MLRVIYTFITICQANKNTANLKYNRVNQLQISKEHWQEKYIYFQRLFEVHTLYLLIYFGFKTQFKQRKEALKVIKIIVPSWTFIMQYIFFVVAAELFTQQKKFLKNNMQCFYFFFFFSLVHIILRSLKSLSQSCSFSCEY